jgi:hypothetical protein
MFKASSEPLRRTLVKKADRHILGLLLIEKSLFRVYN